MLKKIMFLSVCCVGNAAWSQGIWVDNQHEKASQNITQWANKLDNWFGEPNPDDPASATLRVMVDTHWHQHDGVKVKPRVRGNVRLPTLKEKVSVVFGDETLDNEILDSSRDAHHWVYRDAKKFNQKQSRDENSSLALRWGNLNRHWGVQTDADVGVRSGSDVYLRLKAKKDVYQNQDLTTQVSQIYRYGVKSKHFARSSIEIQKQQSPNVLIANHTHADYVHHKGEKGWSWGNSTYRQHHFSGSRRLNYGIQASGAIGGSKHQFNSYGIFASWRQPVWRNWLFAQTEVQYANNRDEKRKHYPSGMLRLEAIF
ncbi:hypothetical protein [Alysiella filiformis]|uniref:Uncharacterized protein n=1 Tax=Alysiella filiformis DSM 16848 TaxID=1120981 RepID=A0A286EG21_9NEIS|nr:hypothetical protein [Alysiella filiformis]QMT31216.1 hypothetical protein H3L97_11005 [Alysiella filiformis]UBQ55784.1 hypothetical protein JF568_09460 [Alysiella filiformis DSM 16848]SOD69875.1 hypothetical protein SAMN02746062_01873 [Alysiella filiformis DSM 16848]